MASVRIFKQLSAHLGRHSMGAVSGLYAHRGAIWRGATMPARGILKGGKFLLKRTPLTMAFIGYEASKGRNAPEAVLRGGMEVGSLTAGAAGATAGAAALSFIPGVGTIIGGLVGFGLGYTGAKGILGMGFRQNKENFNAIYMNRRALTMRQASLMSLSRSRRNSFGREASSMHLR